MTRKREISAIDAIYELLDEVRGLDKKLDLMDQNVKLLNNKVYILTSRVTKILEDSMQQPNYENIPIIEPVQENSENPGLILGKIKVYGYIVNKSRVPIQNVSVKLFDINNNQIRTMQTNNDGYWEARLPAGKYGIEYKHAKFKPINKSIKLDNNITSYEVK